MPACPRRLVALLAGVAVVALGCAGGGADRATARRALAGTDHDGNAVRDDVDHRIEQLAGGSSSLAAYLEAVARNTQQVVLLDTEGPRAAGAAYRLATATNVLVSCPPPAVDADRARDLGDEIRSAVANTAGRRAKVDQLSHLISGRSFMEPDCDAVSSSAGTTTPLASP